MTFNSVSFLIFFLSFYSLYVIANKLTKSHRLENFLLFIASLIFYGAWDKRFLWLLLGTLTLDFNTARWISRSENPKARKFWLTLSIVANLSVLGFFKYFNFGVESFNSLMSVFGFSSSLHTFNIILPIGISFYTFQSIAYVVDVYRREVKPCERWFDFAVFVTFFPQLVAGPIERANELMPQILGKRTVDWNGIKRGLHWIIIGYFLKVAIADSLSPVVDSAFASPLDHSGIISLAAIFAYSMQIFGDFAGYSLVARGLASLMGISLIQNFNAPYFAKDMSDFWKRWHISLSRWLRDYLYIPLGGNRKGKSRTHLNLMITMVLGGLWHGASWNFLFWGFYHGALLMFVDRKTETKKTILAMVRTFLLVTLGWFFFRVRDVEQASQIVRNIFGNFVWTINTESYLLATLAAMAAVIGYQYYQEREGKEPIRFPVAYEAQWGLYSFLALVIWIVGRKPLPFIYFQF